MMNRLENAARHALEWIEDAAAVLSHTSTAIQGGLGAEAEGVGGCSVKVLKDLREALAQQQAAEPVAWQAEHQSGEWVTRETPTLPSTGIFTGRIRALYANPAPTQQPLTLPEGRCASEWGGRPTGPCLYTDDEVLEILSAHGITGSKEGGAA